MLCCAVTQCHPGGPLPTWRWQQTVQGLFSNLTATLPGMALANQLRPIYRDAGEALLAAANGTNSSMPLASLLLQQALAIGTAVEYNSSMAAGTISYTAAAPVRLGPCGRAGSMQAIPPGRVAATYPYFTNKHCLWSRGKACSPQMHTISGSGPP